MRVVSTKLSLQAETCQILSFAENPRWSPSVAKEIRKTKKKQDKIRQTVKKENGRKTWKKG